MPVIGDLLGRFRADCSGDLCVEARPIGFFTREPGTFADTFDCEGCGRSLSRYNRGVRCAGCDSVVSA